MKKHILSILFIYLFLVFQPSYAQVDTSFSSPYAVVYNHLYFLQPEHYQPDRSAASLDPSLKGTEAVDYAIKLKQILDGRGLFVHLGQVPEKPDYADSLSGRKVYYLFPAQLPEVFVEKNKDRWQYSSETIRAIPELHRKTYPMGTEYLLKWLDGDSSKTFAGLNSWQYLGILILLLFSVIGFFLLRWIFRPLLKRISRLSFHIDLEDKKLLNRTSHVLALLVVFLLIRSIFPALLLPVKWTMFTRSALNIIITVFLALLVFRILDFILNYFRSLAVRTDSKMDDQLLPIVSQIIRMVIIIVAALQILHLLNVNVTALIAGISIGGLALALAAKDTVSNLIGSLMIFIDRPFQIGDFIEVGGEFGTVTEVGFRSTRIQTKDTSIISIPNGSIANTTLTNKGIRVYRLFEITLGVTYDTPADLIEVFVKGLRNLAVDHPKVINQDYFIHMTGFGSSSLDILFRVYLDTSTYAEELVLKEELSLTILRMAEALGVRFAFPSTTVYVEQFPEKQSLVPEYPKERAIWENKLEAFFRNHPSGNTSGPTN